MPLVGGRGGHQSKLESSRISNLQFCSKPLLVFKRPQQSYEVTWRRGTLDLDSKRTISPHVFCFRPLLPLPHLSETATWDAHVPVSQGPCVRPDGKVGGGKAGNARAQQDPRASLALRLLCPSGLCSRLPRAAAQSSAACARIKHRMVCFCGCQPQLSAASLSLASCPPALASLPHTPTPAEAASGFPSVLCSIQPTALSECPG